MIWESFITIFTIRGPRTWKAFVRGDRWTEVGMDGHPSADHPTNWERLPADAMVEKIRPYPRR